MTTSSPLELRLPTPEETNIFFSSNLGIEVRQTTDKGKALFATKSFPVDALVLREPPAAAIQHTYNKPAAQVCSQCFTFIGSLEDHAARLLFHCSNAGSSIGDGSGSDGSNKGPSTSSPSPPIIDTDILASLATGELKLPYTDTLNLTTHIVLCPHHHHHCCEEMYCSVDCLEKATTSHHSLLCPGNNKNPDNMKAFNQHADDTNDIFRLAAQVVSQIAQSALAIEEDTDQHDDSHNNSSRLHTAWKQSPYYYGWKGTWWDCVALPDDVDDEDSFRKDMKELAMESLDLLRHALSTSSTKWGNIPLLFPALFDIDVWGNIIGMFELNNLAIHVPNPLQKWLRKYYENDDDDDSITMMKAIAEAVESLLEESNCDGNAFYSLQSCANHSCTPNMHAFKTEDETNGDAVLLALSDIEVGEEVTISYIDEELPLEERTMLLKDYGFTCTCSKCCIERAVAAAGEEDGG